MRHIALIAASAAALALAGCASTTENLHRATAMSIGGGIAPERIMVAKVERGVSDVKWTADTPRGTFECSADDMVRRPYCARP